MNVINRLICFKFYKCSNMEKILPGKSLIVESASTPIENIQRWIIDNTKNGLTVLRVFNDKSMVFTGEQGNFNVIAFGQNSNELTFLVINHWNAHAWIVSTIDGESAWTWNAITK